jgi:allantoin racemase
LKLKSSQVNVSVLTINVFWGSRLVMLLTREEYFPVMRILVIIPITGLDADKIEERMIFLRSIARDGTEVEYLQVGEGPLAIECAVDHLQAAVQVIKHVEWAERSGYDAIIVWCGGDPGVEEARTLVDVPVIGPGEAMRLLASLAGKHVGRIHHPLPVLKLRDDLELTYRLTEEAIQASLAGGFDSFYLDCLGMFGMGRPLRARTGLPVVDGGEASLALAEVTVAMGLGSSRVAYPKYPPLHRL